jgi:hypothetical protein
MVFVQCTLSLVAKKALITYDTKRVSDVHIQLTISS